jgi:hypothetical protein
MPRPAWTRQLLLPLSLATALALPVAVAAQDTLDRIENEGLERSEERRETQGTVSALNDKTRTIIDDYRAELKIVEGLETYIACSTSSSPPRRRRSARCRRRSPTSPSSSGRSCRSWRA